MLALQGSFTNPTTKAPSPSALLLLDDVVVSLKTQLAAIHFSVYDSQTAYQAGGDPVFQDHTEAMAPNFSNVSLGPLAAGTLDSQIRMAALQWLQSLQPFLGWTVVTIP